MDELPRLHVAPIVIRSMPCRRVERTAAARFAAARQPLEQGAGAEVVDLGNGGADGADALARLLFLRRDRAFRHRS